MAPRAPAYVVVHGSGYRYKRKVPKHLREVVGRDVWVEYLGSDMGTRSAIKTARAFARRDDLRINLLNNLPPEQRKKAVADGALDIVGSSKREISALERSIPFVEAIAIHTAVDPDDTEQEQDAQAGEIARSRRSAGAVRKTVALKKKALRALAGRRTGLAPLVEHWSKGVKAEHTIDSMWRSAQDFADTVGDLKPRNVTRDHAAKYRDAVDGRSLKPRTKRKYLEQLNTLFRTAMSGRLVDGNPFDRIKIAKTVAKFVDTKKRKPFEPRQVREIFAALPREHTDFQWVTKLIAYHGCRSGEAAQLRKEDVTTSSGLTVLRIHDEFGSVKNAHSVRTIPLHPSCAAFAKYAEDAAGPWIFASFPEWESTGNRRGAPYQRRASDFLRKVVMIVDPDLSMHSFRHLWRTMAREMAMPRDVSKAIMGHSRGSSEHDEYGSAPSLKEQLKWLRKIDPVKD
jgi:integrase